MTRRVRPLRGALVISLTYAVISSSWILLSDRVLFAVIRDRERAELLSAVKGQLFVLVTFVALFVVLNRYLTRLRAFEDRYVAAQSELHQKEMAIRQGYVDVLDAVTGGKLILISEDELPQILGERIMDHRELREPADIAGGRRAIAAAVADLPVRDRDGLVLASSEALTNAVKHAGSGECGIYRAADTLQVVVIDHGEGIDFRALPKATLIQGFSTTNTLGLGFTIMLEVCDRVLLTTDARGTVVVLEVELEGAEPPEVRDRMGLLTRA